MQKPELVQQFTESHQAFVGYLSGLTDQELMYSYQQKWTAGQQLDHIYRSIRPVVLAMSFPKFMLKLLFGKANRSSRSYEQLVVEYKMKLAEGGKASGRFVPKEITTGEVAPLSSAVMQVIGKLGELTAGFSEQELDTYILPHPLLGKLTLREMLYFTIYHVGHHHAQARQNLTE